MISQIFVITWQLFHIELSYTNKSISSLDRETNSSSEQIFSDENMQNNGDNLKDIDVNDCLSIETIYA